MGQRDGVMSPGRRGRSLSPGRSPRKGLVRQLGTNTALLLCLIGLVGLTVVFSGSRLLSESKGGLDRLGNDPHAAIRIVRLPARTMLNKPVKKLTQESGLQHGLSGGLFGDENGTDVNGTEGNGTERNGTGGPVESADQNRKVGGWLTKSKTQFQGYPCNGTMGCRQGSYDASLMLDGDTNVRLAELGVGDNVNGSGGRPWENFRVMTEEEKRLPFQHAGLLLDGDAYVFAQRLLSENSVLRGQEGNGTAVGGTGNETLSGIAGAVAFSLCEDRTEDLSGSETENITAGERVRCVLKDAFRSSDSDQNGSGLGNGVLAKDSDRNGSISDASSAHVPPAGLRISRLSRSYRWNESVQQMTAGIAGRALSGSVNKSSLQGEEEKGKGDPSDALPLWSLGIAELESNGGGNDTWLELGGQGDGAWIRIYRAWLTRDRFLGLFSLLFLGLQSDAGAAAALAPDPPPLLCRVGRNTAPMTVTFPGGGKTSSLLLLHCPLAPTFSDQLTQARPDSSSDSQWGRDTVLLEPSTLLPVTLSMLESPVAEAGVKRLGDAPPRDGAKTVAESSFTLKPLAGLVRQPRYGLAACVGPIDTNHTRADWVEFLEYHAGVIGVEHFFVYVPDSQRDLLSDYEREKIVTVVAWEGLEVPGGKKVPGRDERRGTDWRSLARNQCLWHTRGLAHWTLYLDSPDARLQIGARYGHSFQKWSVELKEDVAIIDLQTRWHMERPADAAALFQRCTWPVNTEQSNGTANGRHLNTEQSNGTGNGRALIAAGSKVRYIGESSDRDQVTPGENPRHGVGRPGEITVHQCYRGAVRYPVKIQSNSTSRAQPVKFNATQSKANETNRNWDLERPISNETIGMGGLGPGFQGMKGDVEHGPAGQGGEKRRALEFETLSKEALKELEARVERRLRAREN